MTFTETEKEFIKQLVAFEENFSRTVVGYSFLGTYFQDKDFALYINRSWGNGRYNLYFNNPFEKEKSRQQLYKYVSLLHLIKELEKNRYITIIKDRQNHAVINQAVILSPYIDADRKKFDTTVTPLLQIYNDGDRIETLDTASGKWRISIGLGRKKSVVERIFYIFDNDNLPIEDFIYGMIFISPELKQLVKDNFETYEEKTIKLAQQSLDSSNENVKWAIKACGVGILASIFSTLVTIHADHTTDNVFVENSPDSIAINNNAFEIKQEIKKNDGTLFIISNKIDSLSYTLNKDKEIKSKK